MAIEKYFRKDSYLLWLIALPGILHFIIFRYIPILGNILAFQDYNIFKGIFGSPFVGLKYFIRMFTYPDFLNVLRNTMILSLYSIAVGFPAPILFALFLNEIRMMRTKKIIQTILYLPHFLSWVVVGGIFLELLGLTGTLNTLLANFGIKPVYFITVPWLFKPIIVTTYIWKEVGWSMILYIAALSSIDPEMYEAAVVDGAGRFRMMGSITLPFLLPTIITLFLLNVGSLLNSNVEQLLIFLNPLVQDVGEVIDTYVYRVGLLNALFSYSTAIGMFKSIIGLVLIVSLNQVSKRTTGESIY